MTVKNGTYVPFDMDQSEVGWVRVSSPDLEVPVGLDRTGSCQMEFVSKAFVGGLDARISIRNVSFVRVDDLVTASGTGLSPGETDGPNTSPNGPDFYIRRSSGAGLIWRVRKGEAGEWRTISQFLSDPAETQAYRDDVQARAEALGWPG